MQKRKKVYVKEKKVYAGSHLSLSQGAQRRFACSLFTQKQDEKDAEIGVVA